MAADERGDVGGVGLVRGQARDPVGGLGSDLVCAECGTRMYYALAKGRFGYFRCIGGNTGREQARINAEVAEAESQLTTDGEKLR